MLENIRGIAHNKLFKFFFFILAVIFAVSLGNFNRSSNTENIVVTVGNEKISLNDFRKARQVEINNLNNMKHLSEEQAQSIASEINKIALNKIITNSLIKQEMKHLGIAIPDEVVAEYIHSDPSFHKNGIFDPILYKELLRQNNLNEDILLQNVSQQVASRFLMNSLTVNMPLNNLMTSYMKNFLLEERETSIITLNANQINFDDIESNKLKEFYTNNAKLFQSQESRIFSYIYFDEQKDISAKETFSEEDLLQEYEKNKSEYTLPERRDFYHFLTPDESIAKELVEALKNDNDHIKIAKKFIEKKVINELFTNQSKDSFLSMIDSSIFSMNENEITKAVKSDLGWHVFKVIKVHPQYYQEFKKIKNIVRENLQRKIAQQRIFELSKQIEDELGSGADFNEIATRFRVKVIKVNGVYANGLDVESKKIDINPKILETAFEVEEDSGVRMLDGTSSMYIVKVEKIIEPKIIDFEKIKDKVKNLYIEDLRSKLAVQAANLISLNLNKPNQVIISKESLSLNRKEIDNIFKAQFSKMPLNNLKFDISVQKIKISRNTQEDSSLPLPVVNGIFMQEVNKASMPFNIGSNKFIIALVTDVSISNNKDSELAKQAQHMSELNYKSEILDQYLEYLKRKFPIKLNPSLIEKS